MLNEHKFRLLNRYGFRGGFWCESDRRGLPGVIFRSNGATDFRPNGATNLGAKPQAAKAELLFMQPRTERERQLNSDTRLQPEATRPGAPGTEFPLSVVAESSHWKSAGEIEWRFFRMPSNSHSVP